MGLGRGVFLYSESYKKLKDDMLKIMLIKGRIQSGMAFYYVILDIIPISPIKLSLHE